MVTIRRSRNVPSTLALLGVLVACTAQADQVYVLDPGVEPPATAGTNLRELPGLRLLVTPDSAAQLQTEGMTALTAAEDEELFLVDLHHDADLQVLALESRLLHVSERFAVIAVDPARFRRLDLLRVCKERLRHVPTLHPSTSSAPATIPKVDAAAKQALVDAISESRYSQIMRELSGDLVFWLGGALTSTDNRYTLTTGSGTAIDIAADYLQDRFESVGYPVLRQTFPVGQTMAENLIAVKTGTTHPGEIVVVGAHYDSKSEIPFDVAPGCEDNASGTAAVLHLAEVMAGFETERTVHFVCFSGEEQGLYGSQYYVSQLGANGWNVTNSLIMDMISAWETNYKVIIEGETPWESLMSLFEGNVLTYAGIGSRKDYFSFGSDHVPFQNANIPCFLAIDWDYGDYAHYHRSTDVYSYVDVSLGWRITRAMAATLADLTNPTRSTSAPDRVGPVTLEQNFPNPFNPSTTIRFRVPGSGHVRLRVFDLSGRLVDTPLDGAVEAGWHAIEWNGRDADGAVVASGLYIYRLDHPVGTETRRMVLAK